MKITRKIIFILSIVMSLVIINCNKYQSKTPPFSESTEMGKMLNEIMSLVDFEKTNQEKIGQKICGRKGGIYPEELDSIEEMIFSKLVDTENFYKTSCPAITNKWGDIAPASNSIEFYYNENEVVFMTSYLFYYKNDNNYINDIIVTFGEPDILFRSKEMSKFFLAYPEKGVLVDVFVIGSDPKLNEELIFFSNVKADNIYLFKPISENAFKKKFISAEDIVIDKWKIVADEVPE